MKGSNGSKLKNSDTSRFYTIIILTTTQEQLDDFVPEKFKGVDEISLAGHGNNKSAL